MASFYLMLLQDAYMCLLSYIFKAGGPVNHNFDQIINHLNSVTHAGQSVPMPDLLLSEMIPGPNYYRYSGSLTTPNCNEIVTWTVFSDPISMSSEQAL